LRLHGAPRHSGAPRSAERHQPRRPLCARNLVLQVLRSARGGGADRYAHSRAAAESLFLRAQGPGAAGGGQAGGSDRAAAPGDPARAQPDADPDHARPGAGRHPRPRPYRGGNIAAADGGDARAGIGGRLQPAGDGLRPEERPGARGPRLRPGRVHARRPQDRARDRGAGEDAFSGRLARLGQGRRHRQLQAAAERIDASLTTKEPNNMKIHLRPFTAALFAGLIALPVAVHAQTQSINDAQRGEIEGIIKNYLLSHPELLQDVMNELEKRQQAAEAEKHRTAVNEHGATIFNSQRQVTLGNPQGDVTVVEFFDYNCGYCKRAMSDMLDLIKNDGKLKFVLKEFPVLGEGSVQAAQVAAAVRMQDKSGGKKYLEFHQKLLGGRGQADKTRALAVAKEVGFDVARI